MWVVGRVVAFGLMVLAGWGVYTVASSPRFDVQLIAIHGNTLLSADEIESAAAVHGVNIFWLNRAQVAERLRALPLVQRVDVGATLPDTVDIQIVERQPVGFWTSGDQTYLVDREGVILKAVDGETAQTRACAGQLCDPRLATLPSVAQAEGQSPMPGDRVDANALATSARLASLLPSVGIQPVSFEWSTANGIEVPTRDGWSARFDEAGNLDQQVATLRSIRDELSRTRVNAQLIDVRFGDRPYFR
jgi:cell division septal protein FtsQ